MRQKRDKWQILLILLLALNLAVTAWLGLRAAGWQAQEQYVLYIGTNDQDSNSQLIPLAGCQAIVERACLRQVNAFTVYPAQGVWSDETGAVVEEDTLVCLIDGATQEQAQAIAAELLVELNQFSILIERQRLDYYFYSR